MGGQGLSVHPSPASPKLIISPVLVVGERQKRRDMGRQNNVRDMPVAGTHNTPGSTHEEIGGMVGLAMPHTHRIG